MSKIKLTIPDVVCTGKMVSFVAPCDCTAVTCLQINDVDYAIVDATCNDVMLIGSVWAAGALITVCLDAENAKAYIQNPGHFAKRSFMVSATLDPNAWNGSAAPFNQSIDVSGVTAESVVEVSLPHTATAEQVAAYQKLNLQDGGQAADYITLRAFGTKNAISIPINIVVRRDI